jgi:transglutaminase-like putative cysteine protease
MTGHRPSLRSTHPADVPLSPRAFDLLCLTMACVLGLHAVHLPWWMVAPLAVVLVGRWQQRRRNGKRAPIWLKLPMIGLLLAAIVGHYGSLFGREPGSAFAVGLLVLKLLESERIRDARVGIAFACFALMSALLFEQGMVVTALVALALAPALATLRSLEPAQPETSLAGSLPPVLLTLAAAIPLALFAFLFVPRLGSPLWGTPGNDQARTGLSNQMAPGDLTELLVDDSPALRVVFDGAPPPNVQRYFRAFVMWRFDGRAWAYGGPGLIHRASTLEPGRTASYEITLEPTHRRVLPALDVPLAAPENADLSNDHEIFAQHNVDEARRYRLTSSVTYRLDPALDDRSRALGLSLPAGFDPRARALAEGWRQQYGNDDAAIVRAALTLFHDGGFHYTLAPAPLGRDSIDDFLFDTREGFCEHYSSAFTFLMRAAGVPARVVTGYQGGYWNTMGNYLLVRQSDAHAWSEVWLEGRGWTRVDPTGVVRPGRISEGASANTGSGAAWYQDGWLKSLRNHWDVVNQWWGRGVIGFDALRQQGLLTPFGIRQASVGTLSIVLAIGCAVLVVVALGWALFQRRDGDAWQVSMARLERKLGRVGIARRASEGPQHYLARAARALPARRKELERIQRFYLDARYGHDEPPPESLVSFRRMIRDFHPGRMVK